MDMKRHLKSALKQLGFDKPRKAQIIPMNTLDAEQDAVSYTHLDVYKRQAQCILDGIFNDFHEKYSLSVTFSSVSAMHRLRRPRRSRRAPQ